MSLHPSGRSTSTDLYVVFCEETGHIMSTRDADVLPHVERAVYTAARVRQSMPVLTVWTVPDDCSELDLLTGPGLREPHKTELGR